MGISVINSYRGGCNFEAIGLSRNLMSQFFPSMSSKYQEIGISGIEKRSLSAHAKAFDDQVTTLPVGGFYRYRFGGEQHALKQNQFICFSLQLEIKTIPYLKIFRDD